MERKLHSLEVFIERFPQTKVAMIDRTEQPAATLRSFQGNVAIAPCSQKGIRAIQYSNLQLMQDIPLRKKRLGLLDKPDRPSRSTITQSA